MRRTKPAENIRSFVDLSHIDRLSRGPEPQPPELPFPEPDAADLIDGPRIALRYGSAATQICISTRMWRRTDGLPETRWHFQNRWRSIRDYSEEACVVGKLVVVNNAWNPPYQGVAGETDDGHLSIDGHETFLTAAHVTVIETVEHLNLFEQALKEAGYDVP